MERAYAYTGGGLGNDGGIVEALDRLQGLRVKSEKTLPPIMSDEQFEDALRIALQESTKESTKSDEDDQMLQALAESKVSLMEYQDANHSEDELLQRAMEESAAEEERRNAYRREQEMLAMSQDAILIEEVKRLSLMQQKEKDVSGRSNVD